MNKPTITTNRSNGFKFTGLIPVVFLFLICSILICFFRFDIFLSNDSACDTMTQSKLLRAGFGNLDKMYGHGFDYFYGVYLLRHILLRILSIANTPNLIEVMNLFNNFAFLLNILLLYLLLRRINFDKVCSAFLALLYFFIPIVFQASLYNNSNTFALSFFILSNIFFASYLKHNKTKDLILVFLFFAISTLMKFDSPIFYTSFIAMAIMLNKPVKKPLLILAAATVFSVGFFIILKHILSINVSCKADFVDIYKFFFKKDFYKILVVAAKILCAAGIGLVGINVFLGIRYVYMKKYRIFAATIVWVLPIFAYYLLLSNRVVGRHLIPAFIGFLIIIGESFKAIPANARRRKILFILTIFIVHFASMHLSYYLVERYYPLKRAYKPGERIVLDHVPIGNIFVNAHTLREEKRRVWCVAEDLVKGRDKVIVLSNNTNRAPHYYFLYFLFDGIKMEGMENAKTFWSLGRKEFLFIDVLPGYDIAAIKSFLNNPRFSKFAVHFPPFIPERIPELYEEIKLICEEDKREIL